MKRLIILDGHAIIHRSFHALPPTMKTRDGQPTNAVYGFVLFLLKAIYDLKPDYIALTMDKKGPTFRHEAFTDYKATRVKAPDELYEQIPLVEEVATAFDIPIYSQSGFEADDIIGTICQQTKNDLEKIIITGDLDTIQLINKNTKVYTMSRGISDSVIYDEQATRNRFGFEPIQMIDYKALRGDVSDNIPGVKGIGEKTAGELIKDFKSLDNLYKQIKNKKTGDKIRPKTLELLIAQEDQARMSYELATIKKDAPIKFNLEDNKYGPLNQDKIAELFSRLEFKSLISRLPSELGTKKSTAVKKINDNKKYIWVQSEIDFQKLIKNLKVQKILAVDTETTDLDPLHSELIGLSFSYKSGEAYFVRIETDQKQIGQGLFASPAATSHNPWLLELKTILENPQIKKCGHNLKFDYRVLKKQGIIMAGIEFDSLIASYLLHSENRQHSLDSLAFSKFNHTKIAFKDLVGSGKNQIKLSEVEPQKLAQYACEDADFAWRLYRKLEPEIQEANLEKLFNEIEMPLITILGDMEDNGITIDRKVLKDMDNDLGKQLIELEKQIHKLADVKFNINSPKQLKEILFDKLAISPQGIKKTKTGLSTAADELEKMKSLHPIIPLIQDYRELAKLLSTYIRALPNLINPQTGRVHTSYNQAITTTGRLSSTEPNLQNIPTKTELGQKIRRAFVAQTGWQLLSLDYSQIELRILAHLSRDPKMIEAFQNNLDIHKMTAAEINQVKLADVTPTMRREAKAINFGIIYGQGPHGLSQSAGIPYWQAKEFIDRYFTVYKNIKKLLSEILTEAKRTSYVETMLGRKRYLPDINSHLTMLQKSAERMAINLPFQGTAADMIKKAMVEVYALIKNQKDIKMLLQVHDELIFEVKKESATKYEKEIAQIMSGVLKLKVPIIVDGAIGQNWGEL